MADQTKRNKIEQLVRSTPFNLQWVGSVEDLKPKNVATSKRFRQSGEDIFGSGGALLDILSRVQPIMLIFDRDNGSIPWKGWLPMLKSSPATRRIPILLLADNSQDEPTQQTLRLGVSVILGWEEVDQKLLATIHDNARIPDYDAIQSACEEPIDPRALDGIAAYNSGGYYDAHEYLEDAWRDDKGSGRDLYRSILQIAVALYQVQRDNYNGAVKMLLRVQQWLHPLPDICRGVDVAALKEDATHYYETILDLGPERLAKFDWKGVRPVNILSCS